MSNKSSKKARSSTQILTEIAAITAGRKLKDLVLELSLANARELASAEMPLKKLAHLVLRGAAKIHAVVDAA